MLASNSNEYVNSIINIGTLNEYLAFYGGANPTSGPTAGLPDRVGENDLAYEALLLAAASDASRFSNSPNVSTEDWVDLYFGFTAKTGELMALAESNDGSAYDYAPLSDWFRIIGFNTRLVVDVNVSDDILITAYEQLSEEERGAFLLGSNVQLLEAAIAAGVPTGYSYRQLLRNIAQNTTYTITNGRFIATNDLVVPGRVQSRVNLRTGSHAEGAGWAHLTARHYNPEINASQFSITQDDLRTLLQSSTVVQTPVARTLNSGSRLVYLREVNVGVDIGTDKFNGFQPTSVMTVLTDRYGNLVTATPGVIP